MRTNGNLSPPIQKRPRGRPFAKGNGGRKLGSRNRATLLADALLEGEQEELVRKGIELAKAGDPQMLKFFLDRILPKERPVKIDLPPIEHRRDLTAAYAAIVQAVGAGELAPGEGSAVAALLASIARFIDDAEVEARTLQPGKRAEVSADKIMIRRELKSQLIELEKRYAAAVHAKRDEALAPARWAHWHAIQVAAVVLYGEPKMEEPLRLRSYACKKN